MLAGLRSSGRIEQHHMRVGIPLLAVGIAGKIVGRIGVAPGRDTDLQEAQQARAGARRRA